jgi:hypothetical protein
LKNTEAQKRNDANFAEIRVVTRTFFLSEAEFRNQNPPATKTAAIFFDDEDPEAEAANN